MDIRDRRADAAPLARSSVPLPSTLDLYRSPSTILQHAHILFDGHCTLFGGGKPATPGHCGVFLAERTCGAHLRSATENPTVANFATVGLKWRGQDSNLRPRGYEPRELPGCSTPRGGW